MKVGTDELDVDHVDPFRWTRRDRQVAAGLATLGVLLRLIWGLKVDRPPQGLVDPARYIGFGQAIADGQGFIEPFTGAPTAYYPPGYPWFVGIVTWLSRPFTDSAVTAIVIVQALLGAVAIVAGGIIGRRLGGRRVALASMVGLAIYPNLIFHSGAVLGETLYIALFLSFCAVTLSGAGLAAPGTRRVVVAGVLLGLAVMVRPISLAIVPVLALAWWVETHDRRLVLRSVALTVVALVACIVPWTVRNAIRMDAFVPISTNTGENLCIGHADGATGAFTLREACDTELGVLDGPQGEVAADEEKQRLAIEGFLDDPGREPWLLWRRFWFTWVRDGDHDGVVAVQSYRLDRFIEPRTEQFLTRSADLAYWTVCVTGVLGLAVMVRRRSGADLLVAGSALATAAVPLLFFGDSRFKVPVLPLLIIAAAMILRERTAAAEA